MLSLKEITERIILETGLSREHVMSRISATREYYHGRVTESGAASILAYQLGVVLDDGTSTRPINQKTEVDRMEQKPKELETLTPEEAMAIGAGERAEIKELMEGGGTEKSKIATVKIERAGDVYVTKEGDVKAKDPERSIAVVTAENGANINVGLPKGMTYTDGTWKVENKLKAQQSLRNKTSTLRAFVVKYGRYPNVGVEVETGIDDDGFARIVV